MVTLSKYTDETADLSPEELEDQENLEEEIRASAPPKREKPVCVAETELFMPALQRAILDNAASYVRPGGLLLYSTCTLVWAENEGVVEAFLKENHDFSLEPLELPSVFPKNETGMLALVPGQYETDGFFIAKLRRKA